MWTDGRDATTASRAFRRGFDPVVPHVEEDPGLVHELEHHDVVELEVLGHVFDVERHALQDLDRLPDGLLVVQPRLAPVLWCVWFVRVKGSWGCTCSFDWI